MAVIIFLLLSTVANAECLTKDDIKANVCWALCRTDGFDTGQYESKTKSCICGQRKSYKEMTDKVLMVVPNKKSPEKNDDYEYQ